MTNVWGRRHFCIFEIICERLKTFRKVSQTVVRGTIVIPFFFLHEFFGESRQFPGVGSTLHSGAGLEHVRDESCGGNGEDELVTEFGDNPGTTRSMKFSFLQRIFCLCLDKCGF